MHHFPFLMVSARNKDQNVSESISSIRAELLKKNQETAPKKHKMCKNLFVQYLKEQQFFVSLGGAGTGI